MEERNAISDHYCQQASSLIAEALGKGVNVSRLSESILFPFGMRDWPGKDYVCFAAVEITRSAVEHIHCAMQGALQNHRLVEANGDQPCDAKLKRSEAR